MTVNRKHAIIGVCVLVVAAGIGGVRIADPLDDPESGPQVDLTDTPGDVAFAALRSTETADYTVTVDRGQRTAPNTTASVDTAPIRQIEYENSDRQALSTDRWRDPTRRVYTNPYFTWSKPVGAAEQPVTRTGIHEQRITDRFHNEELLRRCGCVQVRSNADSTLTLRIDDTRVALALREGGMVNDTENRSAGLTIYADTDTGALERAVYSHAQLRKTGTGTADDARNYLIRKAVDRYDRWGTTEVTRPGWAGYSVGEAVADVTNVERDSWIGGDDWPE